MTDNRFSASAFYSRQRHKSKSERSVQANFALFEVALRNLKPLLSPEVLHTSENLLNITALDHVALDSL